MNNLLHKAGVYQRTSVPTYQRTKLISGLYAIVDSGFCPASSLPQLARQLLDGGCRLLQLRMKGSDARDVERVARAIAELKREYAFTFIVNDRADVARKVGADGVHIGANDGTIDDVRRRAGDRLLIGYSAHALEEAVAAAVAGATYVAFGAIFPTATKGPGHPVQGIAALAEVVRAVSAPVVAIGGIGRENVRDVLATGCSAVAMIRALSTAPDATSEARWFTETIDDTAGSV